MAARVQGERVQGHLGDGFADDRVLEGLGSAYAPQVKGPWLATSAPGTSAAIVVAPRSRSTMTCPVLYS